MNPPRHEAYVGLGANLGEPAAQLKQAIDALKETPGIELLQCSSLYGSAPVDAPGQPDYVNAVARIETTLPPQALLDTLLGLEARFGRARSTLNAARTLDLDLLLYDEQTIEQPSLRVPHPRMHLRRFVLEPLVELAPRLQIPGRGIAAQLLEGLSGQAVYRLAES
jgi:2-amino-4-hydroxy-6-hydroxymethyldihydropteridine diphosphokinase